MKGTAKRLQADHDRFYRWLKTASEAEQELHTQATKYEDRYFKDMSLKDLRIRKKLAPEGEDVEGDQLRPTVCQDWLFRCRRLGPDYGTCERDKKTITIRTGLVGDDLKGTLLHEMIHAYIGMHAEPLREWLLIDLYRRLKRRIGERKLYHRMVENTHTALFERSHGLLFGLKSLELDERLGWEHWTVFGYGRNPPAGVFPAEPGRELC